MTPTNPTPAQPDRASNDEVEKPHDPVAYYEAEAEEFHKALGIMAPGKDMPGTWQDSVDAYATRAMCWNVWLKARGILKADLAITRSRLAAAAKNARSSSS